MFSDYSETEFKVRNRKLSEKNKTLNFFKLDYIIINNPIGGVLTSLVN